MNYSRFVVVVAPRNALATVGIVPSQTTFYHNEADIRSYLEHQKSWVISPVMLEEAMRVLEKYGHTTFYDYKAEWSFLVSGMIT